MNSVTQTYSFKQRHISVFSGLLNLSKTQRKTNFRHAYLIRSNIGKSPLTKLVIRGFILKILTNIQCENPDKVIIPIGNVDNRASGYLGHIMVSIDPIRINSCIH